MVPYCVEDEISVESHMGLRLALEEAYGLKMVIEFQWHWPYCLWMKTKADHLAELNRGVVHLNALKQAESVL